MSSRLRTNSLLNRLGIGNGGAKKGDSKNQNTQQPWLHSAKDLREGCVTYHAKYLGSTEVPKAKGVEVVKDAIKKLKISRQVKKSEVGNKGSKLPKVEINISIDSLKILDDKSRQMICNRPLHRVSYCADDHNEKKLFAFIAKDQEMKKHQCFVFICEKMASELTLTLGQAFQMAYRRYVEEEKADIKKNRDMISLEKEIEKMRSENVHLRKESPEGNTDIESPTKNDRDIVIPSTPQLQSLSNPFPASPLKDRDIKLIDTSFEAQFSVETKSDENFDPFATQCNEGGGNTNDNSFFSQKDNRDSFDFSKDDFFTASTSSDGGGISAFDLSPSAGAGGVSGFEFHSYDFGTSPKENDFVPKVDPFADTPDWESVASEEVNGSVSSQPFTNPFSSESDDPFGGNPFANENTVTTTQFPPSNNDLFSSNQTGSVDLFANQPSSDFFSNTTQQQNTGSFKNSQDIDLFSNQSNDKDISQNENNDIFSQYLSTVAAREPTSTTSLPSPFEERMHIEKSIQGLTLNDSSNSFDAFGDPFSNKPRTVQEEERQQQSQTSYVRPRPNGVTSPQQVIPAPPTKQAIKSTKQNTPTPSPVTPSLKEVAPSSPTVDAPTVSNQMTTKLSSSHVLPNVRLSNGGEKHDTSKTRSRTRSSNSLKPLKDSIQNASKSLEDLVDCDENPPTKENRNPFQPSTTTKSPEAIQNQQDFFRLTHSPHKTQPSFQGPYESFNAAI